VQQILVFHARPGIIKSMLPAIINVQNYTGSGMRGQIWSLAVEEHFYLVLPLLLVCLLRRPMGIRLFPRVAIVVMAFCLTLRCVAVAVHGRDTWILFGTLTRMDSLFAGVLLAYLSHIAPDRLRWAQTRSVQCVAVGAALLLAVGLIGALSPITLSCGLSFAYLGAALILLGMVALPAPSHPVWLATAWLGRISYGVYLVHVDFSLWLRPDWFAWERDPSLHWLLNFCAYAGLSILTGLAVERAIILPCLAIRDRYFP
jgi:peptidoglycan/LPS O-acetylase OafA/YrhL